MAQNFPNRCVLIGADSLLAQCAEILLAQDFEILGIVTDAPRIQTWAKAQDIAVLSASSDYAGRLQQLDYDYLFAITHLALIPPAAVTSPKHLAINFHDGPLPAYAGLNTPMWALLEGASDYGISWHLMAADIDAGDILLQQPVAISADDSALSLNTKCFAAALESFPQLLQMLKDNSLQPVPQDLARRTYFGRNQRPALAGVLDWQRPAAELARWVRALDTGSYANPLAAAKMLLPQGACLVQSAQALPDDTAAQQPPGTLLQLDPELHIQTAAGILAITALSTLQGEPLPLSSLGDQLQLGRQLPTPPASLAALIRSSATQEQRWLQDLLAATPLDLPYRLPQANAIAEFAELEFVLPADFRDLAGSADLQATLAPAFILFLQRLLGAGLGSLVISDSALVTAASQGADLFAGAGYWQPVAEQSAPAWEQLQRLQTELKQRLARGPWLRDLIARQPQLRQNPLFHSQAPVALVLGDEPGPDLANAELCLLMDTEGRARFRYDMGCYDAAAISRLCDQFLSLLQSLAQAPATPVGQLQIMSTTEQELLLVGWNETAQPFPTQLLVHQAFEAQVALTPDAVALVAGERQLSYQALDQRAQALALELQAQGVGPDVLVGVHVERSIELLVATLAVLKAGGAYVPLDPAFPAERLAFMIEDSAMPIIITQTGLSDALPATQAKRLLIDSLTGTGPTPTASLQQRTNPDHLAYVIYTSGSTGRPKGVMIEHRNVQNFFTGMDAIVPRERTRPEVWLAVTSLSFDISVLELFWTLARGFKVVIYDESRNRQTAPAASGAPPQTPTNNQGQRPGLKMGLFMWGNDDAPGPAKYRLLMEGARFFDANGFHAVWTPERHFHAFGGPYPNPAVTGAAAAAVTQHLKIRAGSCVVPLHHPVRIAEEWGVVDNLSNGRVELAAASGWNPNDFVLKPENHANNKQVMFDQLEQVRRLWRGEKLAFPGPLGDMVAVQSLPRPVQPELPCWITTAGNPETWRDAGARGLHVLTHLLGQNIAEVGEKIRIYRQARADAGFDPAAGQVALMLHTFVGDDRDVVRELVREPMKSYLASSMKLAMDFAWSFPAFKRPGGQQSRPEDVDIKSLSAEEVDTILDFAFERYFETSGLFGDQTDCLEMLSQCASIGVTEIACLLDFGVATDTIMQSLPALKALKDAFDASHAALLPAGVDLDATAADHSFAAEVARHQVTHLQCTPSMARMFTANTEGATALAQVPHLLLGGEALPQALAQQLRSLRQGTLTNVYGPTETTIWSLSWRLTQVDGAIPIGRPMANTRTYVLDDQRRPVPVGMTGELFIGGAGVARGYLGRPALTAERFGTDPFCNAPDARIYATGDLVRYRPDGVLEYIGRNDFQVKVRGYRIELGEIEAQLEALPDVQEAAVVVREDEVADQRLVAYLVTQGAADPQRWRAQLRDLLPSYMLPNDFVVLADMPRTANGKLDRKALLALQPKQATTAVHMPVAAEGDIEQTLVQLWQQVLKLDSLGVNDNFFDLGGHSLLVVQLHAKLKQLLPQPVSLTDLYRFPTIRALAEHLRGDKVADTGNTGTSRGERRRAMRSRRG